MTSIHDAAPIKLKFFNLADSDRATFERVLSFFSARGNTFQLSDDAPDLVITPDDYNDVEEALNLYQGILLLVVTDELNCPHGDLQLQRPLLVTRVMRVMEQAAQKLRKNVPVKEPEMMSAPAPAPVVEAPETEAPETDYTDSNQYRALVIDDNAAIRKQLEIELRTSGIPSDSAESGEQALESIKSMTYDLIFLDIMMPGIDGYETCGRIRSSSEYKKTPIIMLSGKTAPLDEVKGVIAGATTYLTKPIVHDEFQKVLGRITRWLNEFR